MKKIPYIINSLLFASILSFASTARASLVYYLPFDDGTNASLQNDGTITGDAVSNAGPYGATKPLASNAQVAPNIASAYSEYFPITGNRGGSISLPSSTDQFRFTSSSEQMTLSTWIYFDGSSSEAGIVNTRPSNETSGWRLAIGTDGKLKFTWNTNTGNQLSLVSSSAVVNIGQWVQVTATWDCSSTDPLKYYVNGSSVALASHTSMNGLMNTGALDITLGVGTHDPTALNSGGYEPLNGYLDDYAMWNTVLTTGKIRALNTAPSLLNGYNAGVMNSLFSLFDSATGTLTVDGLTWSYASGFDTAGHSLGDTWTADGKDYMWLDTTSGATGLMAAAVPEPKTAGLLLSGAGFVLYLTSRRRSRSNS